MGRKKGICAYCARKGFVSSDHLPPKCIFPGPFPKNMITVPCCDNCHRDTGPDDEYFRTMVVMREDIFKEKGAQTLWPTVLRSLARDENRRFTSSLLKNIKPVRVFTKAGLYLGIKRGYDIDLTRICRVLDRITKGLHFKIKGYPVPIGCEVGSFGNDQIADLDAASKDHILNEIIRPLSRAPMHSIGQGVFDYKYAFASDNEACSVWTYRFYSRISFISIITPDKKVSI